jgi:hypothetical protein
VTIRSHRTRFRFRLKLFRVRQLRNPLHATATSRITTTAPIKASVWLFHLSRDRPNRTSIGRHTVRLEMKHKRRPGKRRPRLRMDIKEPSRLFLPRRGGIHGGPMR